jgi:hypothetical protein
MNEEQLLSNAERPAIFNIEQIEFCNLWGDFWRHAYLDVSDSRKRSYRIKEEALLNIFRGCKEFYVVPKYGRYYLETYPPKPRRRR